MNKYLEDIMVNPSEQSLEEIKEEIFILQGIISDESRAKSEGVDFRGNNEELLIDNRKLLDDCLIVKDKIEKILEEQNNSDIKYIASVFMEKIKLILKSITN